LTLSTEGIGREALQQSVMLSDHAHVTQVKVKVDSRRREGARL